MATREFGSAPVGPDYKIPVALQFHLPAIKTPHRGSMRRRLRPSGRVCRRVALGAVVLLGGFLIIWTLSMLSFNSIRLALSLATQGQGTPAVGQATSGPTTLTMQGSQTVGESQKNLNVSSLSSLRIAASPFPSSPFNVDNRRRGDTGSPNKGTGYAGKASSNMANKHIVWQAQDTVSIATGGSDMFEKCPVKMCTLSTRFEDIPFADAVVFDTHTITRHNPPKRREQQIYIYYSMKPSNEVRLVYFFSAWRAAFNWTWSYRRDADIFQPVAYLKKINPPQTFSYYHDVAKLKSELAVNFKKESESKSQSKDEEYIAQLGKEISVSEITVCDSEAKTYTSSKNCRERQIGEMFVEEAKGFFDKHFFSLSFEKVLCDDYVTEKFFDLFDPEVHVIPVVRGRVDYRSVFPPQTFIDAADVSGPKELGQLLAEVASNKKMYSAMLWQKAQYVKQDGLALAWCQLCEKLHSNHGYRNYDDIQAWCWKEGLCHPSRPF